MSPLELIIVIVVALIIFMVLWKFFRWALEAVVVFMLVLVGLYIALRILDAQGEITIVTSAWQWIADAFNELLTVLGIN